MANNPRGSRKRQNGSAGSKRSRKPGNKRKGSRLGRLIVYWSALFLVWAVLLFGALVAYLAHDLPGTEILSLAGRSPGITFLASNGAVLGTSGPVHALPVKLADLPVTLSNAVLAIEDRRFYQHIGVDLLGVARAAIRNISAGRVVQGGSTISQQLAKNLFLTPEKSYRRKFRELLLALWLERKFTKEQLLTIYLNRVYLGAGVYGVEAAALRYFGKSSRNLTLAESAMIAGLLKAPSRYAPTVNLPLAQSRASQVLDAMVASGWLDLKAASKAKRSPATPMATYKGKNSARYFVDWVLSRVPDYVAAYKEDLTIRTTLDPEYQQAADNAFSQSLKTALNFGAAQGAIVVLGPGGAVRAMIGGRDYNTSQFNRATQAVRQPGSAFKLFVYLAGLENGFLPSHQFMDESVEIAGWRPRNYDGNYRGRVTLREAFVKSINTVAVQLAEQVGRSKVIAMARRLGVTLPMESTPSLALGTTELTLFELTSAYASVASGGKILWPFGIVEIRDRTDKVLYRRQASKMSAAMEPLIASTMDKMLMGVVAEGTGQRARLSGAAGKTGTSQDFRDAWFVGYRGEITAGVWLGNDDATPMAGVTGGGLPAELWHDFMVQVQP